MHTLKNELIDVLFTLEEKQVLWLDTSAETVDHQKRHRSSAIQISRFNNGDECERYIRYNDHYPTIMIVSGELNRETITNLHNLQSIRAIYICSSSSAKDKTWTSQLKKVSCSFLF